MMPLAQAAGEEGYRLHEGVVLCMYVYMYMCGMVLLLLFGVWKVIAGCRGKGEASWNLKEKGKGALATRERRRGKSSYPHTHIRTQLHTHTYSHAKPYTTTHRHNHDKQTPSSSPRPSGRCTLHPHPTSIQATTTITPQCLLHSSSRHRQHRHHQNRTRRVQEDVEIRHGLRSTTTQRPRKESLRGATHCGARWQGPHFPKDAL